MQKTKVSVVRYDKPYHSLKQAVLSCAGLENLSRGARVFIKPNIVFWNKKYPFPKWGVITTSRVVEDVVLLLKEHGVSDITIGEGMVTYPENRAIPLDAFEKLGYGTLQDRYGVKCVDIMQGPFEKVEIDEGTTLNLYRGLLESDFLITLPALKSHNQTVVSLGIKNLKGALDVASRKKCHSADRRRDLHWYVSRLDIPVPPGLAVIDGIYSLERGPGFDGRMRRSNILVASPDYLSADKVGAKLLGYDVTDVDYLRQASERRARPCDLSDLEIVGEDIAQLVSHHEHDFIYESNETGEMPRALARDGLQGLFYRKYDQTMCTYCSRLNGVILTAIRRAWQNEPWDRVEVLTGKAMEPAPGMGATVLVGQCMYNKNRDHPAINRLCAAKGCPPDTEQLTGALHSAGIAVDPEIFKQADSFSAFFMERYRDNPDYEESFYQVVPGNDRD